MGGLLSTLSYFDRRALFSGRAFVHFLILTPRLFEEQVMRNCRVDQPSRLKTKLFMRKE
jgi:hypothetical protein